MDVECKLAVKDCRVCNRRRIKCDRKQPACGKCEKKGLQCSGYGLILKWDQGVASRGNLKGKSTPVLQPELSKEASLKTGKTQDSLPTVLVESRGKAKHVSEDTNVPIYNALVPLQLQSSGGRRLLYHYERIVAPNMTWGDSPENPWRQIVIPLAYQYPHLMASILAFAAKHLDAISTSPTIIRSATTNPTLSAPLVINLQQRATKLLAQELHHLTPNGHLPDALVASITASVARSNAILATMLVLCNVETVWPDSSVWQVHLNAARTVMESRQSLTSNTLAKDSTSTFLEQELYIANAFASTTNFRIPMVDQGLRARISPSNSIFVEFLKLIEMITSLERQALADPSILSSVTLAGLRKLFEGARSRIVNAHTQDYLHLGRTVNCFYHAGIIYSCRALLKDTPYLKQREKDDRDRQISISTTELFQFLDFGEPSRPTFTQDLVWPLFIAGTEAARKSDQLLVVRKLQQAMLGTGFTNCQHALEFLKELWRRRDGGVVDAAYFDWIHFARQWTSQGRTFFVF